MVEKNSNTELMVESLRSDEQEPWSRVAVRFFKCGNARSRIVLFVALLVVGFAILIVSVTTNAAMSSLNTLIASLQQRENEQIETDIRMIVDRVETATMLNSDFFANGLFEVPSNQELQLQLTNTTNIDFVNNSTMMKMLWHQLVAYSDILSGFYVVPKSGQILGYGKYLDGHGDDWGPGTVNWDKDKWVVWLSDAERFWEYDVTPSGEVDLDTGYLWSAAQYGNITNTTYYQAIDQDDPNAFDRGHPASQGWSELYYDYDWAGVSQCRNIFDVDDVHLGAICADFDLNFLNGLAATLAGDDFAFIVDSRSGILLGASESSIDIIKYYSYSSYAMNYVNNIAENELYGLVDDWVSERYGNQQGNLAWQYGNITDDTATDQIIASTGGEYFLQMSTYSQNGLRFSIFKLIDADKIVGQVVASRDLTIVIVTFLALIIILVQVATGIWLDRLTFDQNSLKALLQALENKWNESRNITRGLKQDIRVSRLLQWVWHLKTPTRSQDTKHARTIDDVIELAGVYMGWSSTETKTNAATLKNTQLHTGSRVGSRISSTGNNGNSAAKTLLFNVSAMMSSPVTSGIFKMATLDSSHSSENVSFLEIVHDYHDSDAKERKRLAPIITRLFIEDGSPLELNVSSRLKDKIMSETFRANDNLYKPAVKEIVRLLATNSRKFFRTGAFSACEQLADMYKKHGAMYVSRSNNRSTTENSWFGTKASRLHSKLSSKRTESETASFFGDSRQSYNEDRGSGSIVGSDTGSISMESANVHPHSTIVAPADLDTIEESGPGPVPTLHTPQEQEQPHPEPPHGERNAE